MGLKKNLKIITINKKIDIHKQSLHEPCGSYEGMTLL